jgi:hypothetical protein
MLNHVSQGQLLGSLPLDPLIHSYACVGCVQRAEAMADVWKNDKSEIEGALIDIGWSAFQLIASTRDAARELIKRMPQIAPAGWRLSFPEWAMRDVAELCPGAVLSFDIYHLCRQEDYKPPVPSSVDLVRVTPEHIERYVFDLELVKSLSGMSWLQCRSPMYGALVDGQIVCIADGTSMTDFVAIVQQVYTVPGYRERGLAKAVVARLTEEVLALGRVSAYAADYTNHRSLSLCRALGYRPIAVFGSAEFEGEL